MPLANWEFKVQNSLPTSFLSHRILIYILPINKELNCALMRSICFRSSQVNFSRNDQIRLSKPHSNGAVGIRNGVNFEISLSIVLSRSPVHPHILLQNTTKEESLSMQNYSHQDQHHFRTKFTTYANTHDQIVLLYFTQQNLRHFDTF
jgi:hypothetical protein